MFVNIANKLLAAFQMRGPKHERTLAPHGVMPVAPSQPYVTHGLGRKDRDGQPFGVTRVPLSAVQIIPRSRYTPKNCKGTGEMERRRGQIDSGMLTASNGLAFA